MYECYFSFYTNEFYCQMRNFNYGNFCSILLWTPIDDFEYVSKGVLHVFKF